MEGALMTHLYQQGHLVVAAIRVLTHRDGVPPSVAAVAAMLHFSAEQANRLCAKLHAMGVIELVEGGFGTRLFVRDHAALETVAAQDQAPAFADAIKQFQEERKALTRKVDAIQAEQAEKKKALYAELEKQLRFKQAKPSGSGNPSQG